MQSFKKTVNGILVEHIIDGIPQPIPESAPWPLFLKPMKLLVKPGDRGLGDIVERVIGPVGGDAYKAWYEKTFGKPCACTKRADALNQRFPLR